MHIMAMDKGILGANGIVGGEIPIATGAAYSAKLRGTEQVTLAFFGDSASNEGTFHESINMAAAWNLPIVYIIENNLFGISVDIRRVTKEHDLYKRAEGYGIPGEAVDGNDVYAVYEAVSRAVERPARARGPPSSSARPTAGRATTWATLASTAPLKSWPHGRPASPWWCCRRRDC